MNPNEIKKLLYKQKPFAKIIEVNFPQGTHQEPIHTYSTKIQMQNQYIELFFDIPSKEAKNFNEQEPAQLLIRWLR